MLNGPSNPFHRQSPTKAGVDLARMTSSDIHARQSWQSSVDALTEGQRKFAIAQSNFGKQPGYVFVPVRQARQEGILPLPCEQGRQPSRWRCHLDQYSLDLVEVHLVGTPVIQPSCTC
jgi:hypothetical protein